MRHITRRKRAIGAVSLDARCRRILARAVDRLVARAFAAAVERTRETNLRTWLAIVEAVEEAGEPR